MEIIVHEANGLQIGQRREDGYINLTQMAQANSKDLYDYLRLNTTKAFLEELSLETGIPGSKIIQVRKGRGDRVFWYEVPQLRSSIAAIARSVANDEAVYVYLWQWLQNDPNNQLVKSHWMVFLQYRSCIVTQRVYQNEIGRASCRERV